MSEQAQAEFDVAGALRDVALSCPTCTKHRERMGVLLTYYAGQKIPLSTLADRKHLDRTIGVLKEYARELGLSFPDYTPVALRPAKEAKEKKPRKSRVVEATAANP